MTDILGTLKYFWEKQICAPEPPELDDELNYGPIADGAARLTGFHPALLSGIKNRAECFGRKFLSPRELLDYALPMVKKMSNEEIHQMTVANLAPAARHNRDFTP